MEHDDNYLVWYEVRHRAKHGGRFHEERWGYSIEENGSGRWQPSGSLAADLLVGTPDSPTVTVSAPAHEDTLGAMVERRFAKAAVLCRSLIGAIRSGEILEAQWDDFLNYVHTDTRWTPARVRRTFDRKEVRQTLAASLTGALCLSTYFGLDASRLRECARCRDPFVRRGRSWTRLCPKCLPGTALPPLPIPFESDSDKSRRRFRKLRARLNRRVERTRNRTARADAVMTASRRTLMLRQAAQDLLRVEQGKWTYDAWDAKYDEDTRLAGGRPKVPTGTSRGGNSDE
jgi:hypothetical protein